MASRISVLAKRFKDLAVFNVWPAARVQHRCLSVTAYRQTDGVFRELTDQRVQIPWIEALRKRQKEIEDVKKGVHEGKTDVERDLTPRSMSASYHSVVG